MVEPMRKAYLHKDWGEQEVYDAVAAYRRRENTWEGRPFVSTWGATPREIANIMGEAGAPEHAWPDILSRVRKALWSLSACGAIVSDPRGPDMWLPARTVKDKA